MKYDSNFIPKRSARPVKVSGHAAFQLKLSKLRDKGLQRVFVLCLRERCCQENMHINGNDAFELMSAPLYLKNKAYKDMLSYEKQRQNKSNKQ